MAGPRRAEIGLGAIAAASVIVLAAAALTAFRVDPAQDVATLLRVQGPRVGLGAAAGALLALAGALRQASGGERPLRELEWLAASVGAAAGGFGLARAVESLPALPAFALGATLGGGVLWAAARALDRPRRATNFGVLALLAVAILAAALAGTYVRARSDLLPRLVAWLLGDLTGASALSSGFLIGVALALSVGGARVVARGAEQHARHLAWMATGIGVGAAGPLAFVGSMVPRAVRWLAPNGATAAGVATSALAGAATVAAIDAVPRLLVGGYDFPFNVPASLLAIPIYLGWNRARLRREVGATTARLEVLEGVAIAAAIILAAVLAAQLTLVVRSAT